MATYISNGTGDWTTIPWLTAATGFGPTAPAAGSPPSNGRDKIVIRGGNVVTYNTSGIFGDGGVGNTAGATAKNPTTAAIILSGGTLRASRTQNTALTAVGVIYIDIGTAGGSNSFFDWGTLNDPVSAVTSTISLSGSRDGNSGIAVARIDATTTTIPHSACFCGLEKTRNTFLTLSALSGQPVINVNSCTNWLTGDLIVIESDTTNTQRLTAGRVTGITGNAVTLDQNLNFTRLSGTRVGNFTSTVTIKSLENAPRGFALVLDGSTNAIYQLSNITIENTFANWVNSTGTGNVNSGGSLYYNSVYNTTLPVFRNIALNNNFTGNNSIILYVSQSPIEEVVFDNLAIHSNYGTGTTIYSIVFGTNAWTKITNSVVYRAQNVYQLGTPYRVTLENCYLNGEMGIPYTGNASGPYFTMNNCTLRSNNWLFYYDNFISSKFNNCTFTYPSNKFLIQNTTNAFGDYTLNNCTTNVLVSSFNSSTPTIRTLSEGSINIFNLNNDNSFSSFNYFYYATTNSSIRKNGITSLSFRPKVANERFTKTFTIPAIQGVTQKIKGNLRFDSAYGNTNPPSISFGGSVASTTFTSPAVPNTWNSFEYNLTPTFTGDIEIKLTGMSSLTSGFVYLDGLNLDPFIKDTRWYGFQVDKNSFKTIDTLTTLTENQVSSVDITNLDRLYDASNYWTINNPLSTSYLDLYTRNGTILDFGNKNIVVNNSASTNFSYVSASNTITIKTPILSAGNNFIGVKTTGNIYLSSNSTIGQIDIYGNVFQQTPVSLSGVYMTDTLSYNTDIPATIEYNNCNMNTVKNDGNAIITIKKINSTIVNGLDNEIADYIPTILNVTLNGGYIGIFDNNQNIQYYQNTDGTIILPSNATGTWKYRIANYGYDFIENTFVVDPNVGATITIAPNYSPDIYVTSNIQTVTAYVDLNTSQKIYNYLSYWTTTSTGINYPPFYSRAVGNISINKNVTLDNNYSTLLNYNSASNLLTLRSSGLNEDLIFASTNAISAINGTTYSNDVKIRASNIDSEFLFDGVTSLTFYPSENDRDANTNAGEILTGNISRFKFGSIVKGVTYSGITYARVNVDGTILLYSYTIVPGRNALEFGTVGTLQQIINNQKTINIGIQKASKLIPHTTDI